MTPDSTPIPTHDDADYETALADPAAYYAEPELVASDTSLTPGQRRRFLTEWAQDIEGRQRAMGEGMGDEDPAVADMDAQRLRRINACLEDLPDSDGSDDDDANDNLVQRVWRRLMRGG